MYRIDNATAYPILDAPSADGPNVGGFFTKGDPGNDIPATVVEDEWLNMVQEEISNVIEDADAGNTALSKASRTQLKTAILAMIAAAGGSSAGQGTFNHMAPYWNSVDTAVIPSGFRCLADDNQTALEFSGDQTVNLSGIAGNVNSLDAGSRTTSSKYILYAIGDSSGTNPARGLWVKEGLTIDFPDGYDVKRALFPFVNNASNQLQQGRIIDFNSNTPKYRFGGITFVHNTGDVGPTNILNEGNATSFTDASLNAFVPGGCVEALLYIEGFRTLGINYYIRKKGDTSNGLVFQTDADSALTNLWLDFPIDPSGGNQGVIQWKADNGTADLWISVGGYTWKR